MEIMYQWSKACEPKTEIYTCTQNYYLVHHYCITCELLTLSMPTPFSKGHTIKE